VKTPFVRAFCVTVDLLQYKNLLKIHRAFHRTLRRSTVRHGGSMAIKGVIEIEVRIFCAHRASLCIYGNQRTY
jgi:hypothetical protein